VFSDETVAQARALLPFSEHAREPWEKHIAGFLAMDDPGIPRMGRLMIAWLVLQVELLRREVELQGHEIEQEKKLSDLWHQEVSRQQQKVMDMDRTTTTTDPFADMQHRLDEMRGLLKPGTSVVVRFVRPGSSTVETARLMYTGWVPSCGHTGCTDHASQRMFTTQDGSLLGAIDIVSVDARTPA